ncbi:MAG: tRNA dihydrouridine synthase DusB [Methylocystis sp.]|jgi:tRNA-dihydrouridine synthase B|nr:tRNA dihydrouridine synthase DusB [Methylocystis sp.]MCA3584518.1 tRNA dihydrouridine synthase DusB [Methylocystis sp.]MCA3588548.1 tRNA dihydrouridine synthase DusB [Methylocystis sp.]MCA3591383.1 tRNA dihydrouridine synthase DusB [Methylocystis sp.]
MGEAKTSAEAFLGTVQGAILAPMSGVTDAGMRRQAQRFGAALVVSEMVASDELARQSPEALLRAEGEGLATHVVQLAGCEAHWMAEGARMAEQGGADVIDINMGCPAKRVTNGWSGSALMRDLDHAARLIEATVAATSKPVTLKMRLGWDDASLNAPVLAARAEALGVRMITVHGRTRCQFYKGQARWDRVRDTVAATRLPVVVNGDVGTIGEARAALAQSGAKAVMVGRAAVGRPWLVGEISAALQGQPWFGPSPAEMAEAALAHYGFLLSSLGAAQGLRHARKHVVAYLEEAARQGSGLAVALRETLCRSDDPDDVMRGLERAFHDIPLRRAA